ncbi:nucleotidyltransferase domain-containing protein, partial [Candidatus Woesearchaeota archaeon]|nr:nucleotidyltransferase domain-containing protein [Candidatus Woesearchaeota archaeon]
MVIMATKSNLLKLEKEIIPVLKKNNVIKAGLFGSYVRGENKKSSDIDI